MSPNIEIKKFIVGPLYTNCYLVHDKTSKEGLLIDPGAYVPEISEYIERHRLKILYTLNTHGHPDHTMADARFGFPVMIHKLDEPYLREPHIDLSYYGGDTSGAIKVKKRLADGDIIKLGNAEFKVIHTPGHTPGSISILHDDVLFSGDTLFFEGIGRTDRPGGDPQAILRSIYDKLFCLPDSVTVLTGHGPETTIGHEKRENPFL